jgi:hypothetical protein
MKNVFKLWFIALAVIIVHPAFAQTEGDFNVDLTEDGSGVVIKGYTGSQRAVTIPAKIQGYPVKEIGDQVFLLEGNVYIPGGIFSYMSSRTRTRLTSVTIPAGVEKIGKLAFFLQDQLTSVSIPASVTSIGEGAFAGCSSLTMVNIPASVTSIGNNAFTDCSKLATVNFSEGLVEIGDGAFVQCRALKTIKMPNSLIELGRYAFGGSGLTSITFGTGMTSIRAYTFSYMDNGYYRAAPIQTIVIPEGITGIGQNAFRECTQLTSVTLPSTLERIGERAFSGCSALTTVTIPATLESIEFYDDVFIGCSKLLLATRAALKKIGWDGEL